MLLNNMRSAFQSIWGNKLRSLLTLLGVVIGVSSVTTLIALGQGLKSDVADLIRGFGTNVIVVMAGKIDPKSSDTPNPANFVSGDILTLDDVKSAEKVGKVEAVAPMSLVSGSVKYGEITATPTLFGATPNILNSFESLSLKEGRMYTSSEGKFLVLNLQAREKLFGSETAVGKKVVINKEEFEVIGVLNKAKNSNALSNEYDSIAFLPFNEATAFNKNQVKINRIFIKASDDADVKSVKDSLHSTILNNHGQEENFTILTQDDILDLFGQFLNLATAMVSAIAAISLVVGGIGIMNIMLVTVTERTREIGLRKAVGATRGAILIQFLTEAVVITIIGGLIGLLFSFLAGKIVEYQTPLQPVFSLQVVLVTVAISVVIGVIFGIWPALRAAKKDPIEALRYE